jgi:hypothetical protein
VASEHGTQARYSSKCRCDLCRKAHAEYARAARARERGSDTRRNAHVVRHGTYNEYNNYGCRCDECKAAIAAYRLPRNRAWRTRNAGVCVSG